mmetsp:Transcript_34721/g.53290  ORF Transcript_34721/g.53290 Transcript_34721/m.53290 type:complete len:108 (+) Transcript_34721:2004-2327(+)
MLQHCAILSQLNRHKDALEISRATSVLMRDISMNAKGLIAMDQDNQKAVKLIEVEKEALEETLERFNSRKVPDSSRRFDDEPSSRAQTTKKERRSRQKRKVSVVPEG